MDEHMEYEPPQSQSRTYISQYRPQFTVTPRKWWLAEPPRHIMINKTPVDLVFFSYTRGKTCFTANFCGQEIRSVQERHMENGAVDIVYNFVIGGNGMVFEGRGWGVSPRLSQRNQRHARDALHIAFMGDFRSIPQLIDPQNEVLANVLKDR